jgi:hypothetical protein
MVLVRVRLSLTTRLDPEKIIEYVGYKANRMILTQPHSHKLKMKVVPVFFATVTRASHALILCDPNR